MTKDRLDKLTDKQLQSVLGISDEFLRAAIVADPLAKWRGVLIDTVIRRLDEGKIIEPDYNTLIDRYFKVKDDLLEYTQEYHDAMLFDIEGYCEYCEDLDLVDLVQLQSQVESCEMLLESLKRLDFTYA